MHVTPGCVVAFSLITVYSSVTDFLNHLKWPTLQERRHINRLSQFHKIIISLHLLAIATTSILLSCQHNFQPDSSINTVSSNRSALYCNVPEFFPNTLREWNSLPNKTIEEQSPEAFLVPYNQTI